MTAAVAPLSMVFQLPDSSSEARKRRREILVSQRNMLEAPVKPIQVPDDLPVPAKRRKLTDAPPSKAKPVKKPQMKYDPAVPMTKEAAAAWRREQRRKRNRESAAASRQRQRDRISELEVEVEDWKCKFDSMMEKIRNLEEVTGTNDGWAPVQSLILSETRSKFVSPPSSPDHSPLPSPCASPVASLSLANTVKVSPEEVLNQVLEGVGQGHSDKMISRHAAS
jgi:hypothetical protein